MTKQNLIFQKIVLKIVLGSSLFASLSHAQNKNNLPLCPADRLQEYVRVKNPAINNETAPIIVNSDSADSSPTEAILTGDVNVTRGNELLTAPKIHLNRQTNVIESKNNLIRYATPESVMEGQSATVDTNAHITDIEQSDYYLNATSAQGSARHIKSYSNEKTSELDEVTYSTCIRGSEVWQLRAKRIELDQDEGRGQAWGVKLAVKNLPILYTPYISFPVDERRQSGWLIPTISLTKDSGFGIRIPYYINIAPELDATITPGFFSKRGLILAAEARYLSTWQTSQLSVEVLPGDRKFKHDISNAKTAINENNQHINLLGLQIDRLANAANSSEIRQQYIDERNQRINNITSLQNKVPGSSANRWSVKYDQNIIFNQNLSASILFQQVSDKNYIKDLDDGIGLLSTTNLERNASVTYVSQAGVLVARVQDFQILDNEIFIQKPYSRLPQVIFTSDKTTSSGFQYGITSELVRFYNSQREDMLRPKIGNRFDIKPYIGYRYETPAGFINPKVAFRFTEYDLNYRNSNKGNNSNDNSIYQKSHTIHRALPIVSIDSGLVFERDQAAFFKSNQQDDLPQYTHTFEPRLYYLYVPYRKQQNIPLFDTDIIAPSYSALFQDNRFTGADRQADANQLTTAITTRLIDNESGGEKLRLSVGQVQYFEAHKVTIGNDIENKRRKSEIISEAEIHWGKDISTTGSWHWDPKYSKSLRTAVDLRYNPGNRRLISLSYRNTQDILNHGKVANPIKQIDFSTFWEITPNWAVLGRYNYSLSEHKTADASLGLEYNDCCIAIRTLTRYSREKIEDPAKIKAYLEIEFIGLGSAGNSSVATWKEVVAGYEPRVSPRLRF